MIWLEFDAWYMDSENKKVLFDTTHENMAEEHGIKRDDVVYKPMPLIVGETPLLKGLEEAILEAEVGEEKEIEIPPEKGFGERDPANIIMLPMNKLLRLPQFSDEDSPRPEVGMEVDFGDRKGTIVYMTSSRVRIDFNPKYAGRTLIYKFKIDKVAETPEDYIYGVFEMAYGHLDNLSITLTEDSVDIILPPHIKVDQNWVLQKFRVLALLRKYLDKKTIRFIEEYRKKEEEEKDEKNTEEKGNGDSDIEKEEKD